MGHTWKLTPLLAKAQGFFFLNQVLRVIDQFRMFHYGYGLADPPMNVPNRSTLSGAFVKQPNRMYIQ